jgi:GTP-binding protein HflX
MSIDSLTRTESVARESAILVGVYLDGEGKGASPLDELAGLAEAAGVRELGRTIQRRRKPEGATYIGSGKLAELKEQVEAADANVVIFDNNLAPSQTKNLEEELKVKVIDRTELILDIFASRAQTSEARLAVELAQLEYSLPRLKRMWTHLERQAVGGVGLRGPGEKQLEVDRRLAQKRILDLKSELHAIHQRRKREVAARKTSRTLSLVGYTNAGKSTLLNRLTDSDVYVKDQLFATLDTRTRRWSLPGWGPVLLSDTVGFIKNLPNSKSKFRQPMPMLSFLTTIWHRAKPKISNRS